MSRIDSIQPNNIFRVNPVTFLGDDSKNNRNTPLSFDTGLFRQQSNDNYNLNHPRVIGSDTQAKNLDILA